MWDHPPAAVAGDVDIEAGHWSPLARCTRSSTTSPADRVFQVLRATSRSVPECPSARWLSTGVAARCTPEGQERSRMRCMELTEALVTEDITPFERERLREALEEEVRRQLPTDRRLVRVVDWDPGGGHAVENAPGMRKYRVAYETEPRG